MVHEEMEQYIDKMDEQKFKQFQTLNNKFLKLSNHFLKATNDKAAMDDMVTTTAQIHNMMDEVDDKEQLNKMKQAILKQFEETEGYEDEKENITNMLDNFETVAELEPILREIVKYIDNESTDEKHKRKKKKKKRNK